MATIEDQNQENITEIKEAEEWTNAQQAISAANEYLESLWKTQLERERGKMLFIPTSFAKMKTKDR